MYREEDFFARARSRPDPRIISHALAGKNIQQPRSCNTFVECGSSRKEFHDNSTILVPTSNASVFDTFATVAPNVEPTHGTSVRDTFAILAPNVKPMSNISILDKFAIDAQLYWGGTCSLWYYISDLTFTFFYCVSFSTKNETKIFSNRFWFSDLLHLCFILS